MEVGQLNDYAARRAAGQDYRDYDRGPRLAMRHGKLDELFPALDDCDVATMWLRLAEYGEYTRRLEK